MTPAPSRSGDGPAVPSANFLLVGLIFSSLGVALGTGALDGAGAAFVFVMAGFVLALCLHEFAHARLGQSAGDAATPTAGYLTLNPRRFGEPIPKLVLPVLLTILSGVGLPGGYGPVDAKRVPDRMQQMRLAAAGPVMSLAILLVLALLYGLTGADSNALSAVLAVSALFQSTALVINLLPIPGLDGYGLVSPWLPEIWRTIGDRIARHAGLVLVAIFLFSEIFGRVVFRISFPLTGLLGFAPQDVVAGYRLIRLW